MTKILLYLFYLCILSLIIGLLGKIPLGLADINLYFNDLVVVLIGFYWLFHLTKLITLLKSDKIFPYFLFFSIFALVTLIFSPIQLTFGEKFTSLLYLLRFVLYFAVYITVKYLVKSKQIKAVDIFKLLGTVGLAVSVIGWLQYFLYPDLRNLYYLGWDPHYKRIFSTFFDPNFLGLILLLSLISLFLQTKRSLITWISKLFIFITLMFTYSRSSYLALLIAGLFYSWCRRRYELIIVITVITVIATLLLPRPSGEGVKLERVFSIEQRVENWKLGLKIFSEHPLLGVGFNTIRYAKRDYGLRPEVQIEDHSGAGFDNSFLFVAAASGIVGFTLYIILLIQYFRLANLIGQISLIAIATHSFFLNSLFFPWIMLWMWILLGTSTREYKLLSSR